MSFLKAFTFGSGKSKHKKLPEEWGSCIKQPVNDGMNFYVKYLGSTLVDEPSSETVTAEAIKTIIAMAKASGKKLPNVTLTVKPTGITTTEVTAGSNGERNIDVSIYRISYCSADANYDRVVAFIATNKNETLECHAFLTSKKKIAQAAALTISQAFTIAFEKWQNSKNQQQTNGKSNGEEKNSNTHMNDANLNGSSNKTKEEPALIDLSDENIIVPPVTQRAAVDTSLDFEFDCDLDDSFSRFADSRTKTSTAHKATNGTNGSTAPAFMLPNNLNGVAMTFQDLPNFFSEANERDGKFFNDDSPDDLFSL